jgi:hypothetical protein
MITTTTSPHARIILVTLSPEEEEVEDSFISGYDGMI